MSTFPASRKGSGRPISRGAVQVGAIGKAANQTVEIADRPMSTHGMTGTRAATGTRQVRDATFFATELLNRIQQTNRERDALIASSNELRRRSGLAGRLAESVEELRKQVGLLQGELHDTTHAQTRVKEGASLDDLRAEAATAEEQAVKLRSDANIAFRSRQEALQRLEKNEATAAKLRADTEQRIFNDLGEDAARQFRQLNAENAQLETQEQELRKKLTEQAQTTAQAYAAAFVLQPQQSQQNVQKAVDLHQQLRAAIREVETLRAELQKDASDDPEAGIRNQLRQQLKQESLLVHRLTDECKQLEGALSSRKRLLTEITPDVMTTVSKEQKDMIKNVLRAEKQLAEWPRQRSEIVAGNQVLQGKVMALLNRLPAPLTVTDGNSDAGNVEQSLSLKTRELERLSDQEGRVLTEVQQVNQRIQSLSEALSALQQAVGDAEAVEDVESAEKQLREELAQQVEEHKALQAKLGEVNAEINDLEDKIQSNDQVQALRSLYEALSTQLSKQYAAESYIRSREAETNYQRDKDFCINILGQINQELAKLDRPT